MCLPATSSSDSTSRAPGVLLRLPARPARAGARSTPIWASTSAPPSGVLVISSPGQQRSASRAGDVVLAVDGRKPEGPGHLLRILRSYEPGESFKLDILRNRKRETVERPSRRAGRSSYGPLCARSQMSAWLLGIYSAHLGGDYGIPVDLDHRVGRRGDRQAADARKGSGRVHRHHAARCRRRAVGRLSRPGVGLVRRSG